MPANAAEFKSLPLQYVYELLEKSGFVTDATVLRGAIPGKELLKRRAKRGMAIEVLRSKGLYDKFVSEYWPNGAAEDGRRRTARYEAAYQEWKNSGLQPQEEGDGEKPEAGSFAYETDLRDYLAKNLGMIESGMQPWVDPEGRPATEFPADDKGRRIDILAKDQHGVPVVIELKVSKGHERVIGQALYYRGSLKQKLNAPEVRIIIVAREISDELRVATKDLGEIGLFEYRLSMTLSKV